MPRIHSFRIGHHGTQRPEEHDCGPTFISLIVCHALFAKPVSVPAGPDSPIIAGEDGGFSETVEYKAVTIAMAS